MITVNFHYRLKTQEYQMCVKDQTLWGWISVQCRKYLKMTLSLLLA